MFDRNRIPNPKNEEMPREHIPLIRERKKEEIVINIAEIFRNPDVCNQVVKNIKKIKQ